MFCTNCGVKPDDNARFCTGCGKALNNTETPEYPQSASASRRLYFDTSGLTFLNNEFTFLDENGAVAYTVKTDSENFIGYTARLFSSNSNEILTVKSQIMAFAVMNFDILTPNGKLISSVIQQNNTDSYSYNLDRLGIAVRGDFLSHAYRFYCNERQIARVAKKFMHWGDCYELEFSDRNLEHALLGAILAFELVWIASRTRR